MKSVVAWTAITSEIRTGTRHASELLRSEFGIPRNIQRKTECIILYASRTLCACVAANNRMVRLGNHNEVNRRSRLLRLWSNNKQYTSEPILCQIQQHKIDSVTAAAASSLKYVSLIISLINSAIIIIYGFSKQINKSTLWICQKVVI